MQEILIPSKENIKLLCSFINKVASIDEKLDDLHIRSDGTFSSYKIDLLLQALKTDCNDYTDTLVANLSRLTLKVVTNESEITESNTMYLYKPDGQTSYNQYVVVDGTKVLLGTTDISMSDYYTITQADAKFVLKTDYDSLVAKIGDTTTLVTNDKSTIINAINECATKSTLTTLTTAEYNTLVSTGSVVVDGKTITFSNDDYYVISDDSSNIDTTKYNIKTFTSLGQLGLTAPVTVGDIYMALPENSIARLDCGNSSISDCPEPYGILMIDKRSTWRFDIEFKVTRGDVYSKNRKYLGILKGDDGTGLTWSRVCTTKVADVSKTNISSNIINSSLSSGGGIYYSVKNGICYVQIAGLSASVSGAIILPSGSVPKTNINYTNGHYPVTSPNATCGLLVFDTLGTVRYYGNSMTIYATISYPVAES